MPIYKVYSDSHDRVHDLVLDEETGETISDTIEVEPDPDAIRDREMEEKQNEAHDRI